MSAPASLDVLLARLQGAQDALAELSIVAERVRDCQRTIPSGDVCEELDFLAFTVAARVEAFERRTALLRSELEYAEHLAGGGR